MKNEGNFTLVPLKTHVQSVLKLVLNNFEAFSHWAVMWLQFETKCFKKKKNETWNMNKRVGIQLGLFHCKK